MRIRDRVKALSATPVGLLTLNGLRGPMLGPDLAGGFAGPGAMFAFPRSSYVDGYWYTMQNASYAYMWQTQPHVPTVIGYIANQFGQVTLHLYKDDKGQNGEEQYDHPAAATTRWPAEHYGGNEWREKMALDYFLYKNAYSVIINLAGAEHPTLLHIPAYAVGVRGANRIVPDGYRILYADGTYLEVTPENMIHWRGPNAVDPRLGWSPMEQLRDVLIEASTRQAANIEFNRGGRIKAGIIKRPTVESGTPEWTPSARQRFEEDWANRSKSMNSGRSPVLEEGMDWVDAGVTPREAEIIASVELSLQTVCNIYGLHPALFMFNPGNTDLDKARGQLFTDVLPGHFRRFAEVLDLKLLRGVFSEPTLRFGFDWTDKLQGEEDKIQKLVGAAGRPVLTANEARAMLGRQPLEGGDELVMMTNVVGVNDMTGKPSTNVMPVPDPNKPAQDGSHRTGDPNAAKAEFEKLQRRIDAAAKLGDLDEMRRCADQMAVLEVRQAKALLSSQNGGVLAQPQLVARRDGATTRRSGYASEIQTVVAKHFRRQRTALKSGSSVRANTNRWNDELAADMRKTTMKYVTAEGMVVAERLMGTFDTSQVVNFVKAGSAAAATGINLGTQKKIDAARGGMKATTTADDMFDTVFDNAINVRAAEIGRTHATLVSGFAAYEAGRQNPGAPGTIRVKEWVPSGGTTDRHSHLQGESQLIASAFSNGMMYPGDPEGNTDQTANCNCLLDVY